MSYAVSRAAQPCTSSPPATATVFHYACLYTHDLRRKQKRWQDGEVKFHTFNKRYMVYDDRGAFIGDGHWQGDVDEFGESLELELDRGAAIVQVDRCTGNTDQDLADILDKRAKEVESRRANAAVRSSAPGGRLTRPDQTPMQHRPLSELMPSRGPMGRAAIPNQSPYEVRRNLFPAERETKTGPEPPSAKERREHGSPPSKMGHAQSLFGTKLTLTSGTIPRSSWKGKALHLERNVQQERPQSKVQVEEEERGENQTHTDNALLLPARVKIARSHAMTAKEHGASSKTKGRGMERALPSNLCSPEILQVVDKQAPTQQKGEEGEEDEDSEKELQHHGDDKCRNIVLPESSPDPPRKRRAKPKAQKLSVMPRDTQRHEERCQRPSMGKPESGIISTLDSESSKNEDRSLHAKTTKAPRCDVASAHLDAKRSQSTNVPSSKVKKAKKKSTDKEDQLANKRNGSSESNPHDVTPLEGSEKRTQLRSKSRPKKGLLVLSELFEKKPLQAESGDRPSRKGSGTTRGEKSKVASYHEEIMGISSDESEDCPMLSKATASRASKRRKEKNEESDDSSPRITKMARKSVKSKEIIGFAVPVNDLIPASFLSMVHPLAPKPCTEVETFDAHKPKIANPATRGKKAARKEDAAGQVPRSIIPFEPALPDHLVAELCTIGTGSNAKVLSEPQHNSNPNPNRGAGSNRDSQNAGAWSKHAEDLLGMTRPVCKAERR